MTWHYHKYFSLETSEQSNLKIQHPIFTTHILNKEHDAVFHFIKRIRKDNKNKEHFSIKVTLLHYLVYSFIPQLSIYVFSQRIKLVLSFS